MADALEPFEAVFPLNGISPKNLKNSERNRGILITERRNVSMVHVFAKRGMTDQVVERLKITSAPGKVSETADYSAISLSPGQWLLVSENSDAFAFHEGIVNLLEDSGYASQQSDARVLLRVEGEKVRVLMERGCRLDLHPDRAAKGFCAQTQMAQVGVVIHQIDDSPAYDLFVYSGYVRDFHEWLLHTAEQFGVEFRVS